MCKKVNHFIKLESDLSEIEMSFVLISSFYSETKLNNMQKCVAGFFDTSPTLQSPVLNCDASISINMSIRRLCASEDGCNISIRMCLFLRR